MIWEKVDTGRYATEYNGHILQALRRDGPYEPDQRPYVAVVDRMPVGDAWNLAHAKTKAIQHVERQSGKAKAERVFKPKPPAAPMIPDPVDAMLVTPDTVAVIETKQPEPPPEVLLEAYHQAPEVGAEPEPDTALDVAMATLGQPGQLAITGKLADSGHLLDTLNALRSALELLREHAELECTVNLPPVLKL